MATWTSTKGWKFDEGCEDSMSGKEAWDYSITSDTRGIIIIIIHTPAGFCYGTPVPADTQRYLFGEQMALAIREALNDWHARNKS